MHIRGTPDKEILDSLFYYHEDTGILIRYETMEPAGTVVTQPDGKSYLVLRIDGVLYKAHRIIWKMLYNEEPEEIDHDDGNGLNNRRTNLKSVTHQVNACNRRKPANNKSGQVGVLWCKKRFKWRAYIRINRREKFLGYFENFDEAVRIRKQAERDYDFNQNHGSERPL